MSINSKKNLVSIIIPVFNRELLLRETLDSILTQTYSEWECIIIDDGSIDSSLNVAKDFENKDDRFRAYCRPWYKKKGANLCRNYGFKLSRGKYILWFDSDDIMDSRMLEFAINYMNKSNCKMWIIPAVYFNINISNIISRSTFSKEMIGNNPAFEIFTMKYFFQTSQVIFRHSSLFNLKQIFNTNLLRNQETDFFIRLLLNNFNFSIISNALVYLRKHDDSITSKHLALDSSIKYLNDFDAYKLIYKSFKKSKFFNDEIFSHFSKYFFKSLQKAKPNTLIYFKLYLFGNIYCLFPSFILSTKIFVKRFLINV